MKLLRRQRDKTEKEKKTLVDYMREQEKLIKDLQDVVKKLLEKEPQEGLSPDDMKRLLSKPDGTVHLIKHDSSSGNQATPDKGQVPSEFDPKATSTRARPPIRGNQAASSDVLGPLNLDVDEIMTFEELCKRWNNCEHEDPIKSVLLQKVMHQAILLQECKREKRKFFYYLKDALESELAQIYENGIQVLAEFIHQHVVTRDICTYHTLLGDFRRGPGLESSNSSYQAASSLSPAGV